MRATSSVVVLSSLLLGMQCARIEIQSPETRRVETFSFEIRFEVTGQIQPGSLEVELNDVSILDRVSGGPVYTAQIEPGGLVRYHGLPDEGGEYTRGSPNVWSNMSYDPQLNLIYAPTGNSSTATSSSRSSASPR